MTTAAKRVNPKFIKRATPKPKNNTERLEALEAAVKRVTTLKGDIATLTEQMRDAESDVLTIMDSLGRKTYDVVDGKVHIHATLVQGSRTALDEGMLQKNLGATLWNKVTSKVLDRKKLEAFIASGEVDPMIVAKATTETPNKPFIKITKK